MPMNIIKNKRISVFDSDKELRISLFRIMAAFGTIISTAAGLSNLYFGLPLINAVFCLGTAALSLFLGIYVGKTGQYRLCMDVTIILIFFVIFTILFLNGGGFKSGMPIHFILAIVFTSFMLEGLRMVLFLIAELCWYSGLCFYAYFHPEAVHPFTNEMDMMIDIVLALLVISVSVAGTMYLQLRLYRRKQEELDQARQEALSANEAKTTFLANMSHDIRTPLNTVMSMNELIAERTVSAEIKGWTDNVRISCDILLSLINDILDLSRIESGKFRLPEAPYLTAQLLTELETMWSASAKQAKLSFRMEAEETLPSLLLGNLDSIRKIVNNLAGNAVKYTDQGGVSLSFSAEPSADAPDQILLCIVIRDTGAGIRPEDLERVFQPFERVNQHTRRGSEGTGLGLPIVKDLVDAMHGTLSLESTPGKGSCFTVRIPQKVQDPEPIGPRNRWSSIPGGSEPFANILAPDARVLVVDDNEFNRQVMCALLKPTLIRTDDVESGQEALEMLEIREYDLILMDIMMPGMNGIETLQQIRADRLAEGTPVIALTADALTGTRERLLNQGFTDYLSKPVSMNQLAEILIKHLGDRVRLVRDPSFRKLPEGQRLALQEQLLPMHIHLDDALELDGGSVDNLRMRAEYFLNYEKEFGQFAGGSEELTDAGPVNAEGLYHFVHSLKSAARSIGAKELSEMAFYIERHRNEPELERLMLPVLREEYRTVCRGERILLEELGKTAETNADG